MSLEKRVKATAKNLEGKLQEVAGELMGDEQQKAEGQIKQMQASAMHTKENLKDKVKKIVDRS